MKVFICWSGRDSRKVAEALRPLLRKVFPGIKVEDSFHEEPGELWLPRLIRKLERTHFGVLCMTPANLDSAWVLFEAGVLSMTTTVRDRKRLCPYLLGVESGDLPSPLGMFQTADADYAGTRKLLYTIARARASVAGRGSRGLSREQKEAFERGWAAFDARLAELKERLEPRKIKVGLFELGGLLASHQDSVIYRIQKRTIEAAYRIGEGRYDRDNLFNEVALAIKKSQTFYRGIVGKRLGKDVADFLEENYNERHLRKTFDEFEATYVLPLIKPRRKRPPTKCEIVDALEQLLKAIEIAVRNEFLTLISKLQSLEW
jgi:hypothetical protein